MAFSNHPYHSALGKYHHQAENPSFKPAEFPNGKVYYYDLTKGWPGFMDGVDILYSDLPWKLGYHKFYSRSELIPRLHYFQFLEYVSMLILASGKPAVMISGDHAGRNLRYRNGSFETVLNGKKARAYLWKMEPDFFKGCNDTIDILNRLTEQYNYVGDMCCGYGRSGRIFAEAGLRFVLSDISPDCVGYITENAGGWGKK